MKNPYLDTQIHVLVGSDSDMDQVALSKIDLLFDKIGLTHVVHVLSAHRNPDELHQYCLELFATKGPKVFIAIAGWAAALAGNVAAHLRSTYPVIGVPLPGGPNSPHDAEYATLSLPPGTAVATIANLHNAALFALQIMAQTDPEIRRKLGNYVAEANKRPKYNLDLKQRREEIAARNQAKEQK